MRQTPRQARYQHYIFQYDFVSHLILWKRSSNKSSSVVWLLTVKPENKTHRLTDRITTSNHSALALRVTSGAWRICLLAITPDESQSMNAFRPRHNGHDLVKDISKKLLLYENLFIFIHITLKFVFVGPSIGITSLVKVMAWRSIGNTPSSEPMMTEFIGAYIRPASRIDPNWHHAWLHRRWSLLVQ